MQICERVLQKPVGYGGIVNGTNGFMSGINDWRSDKWFMRLKTERMLRCAK